MYNCVAEDGSGYYILTPDEIHGDHNIAYQMHNFHMAYNPDATDPTLPPQQTRGYSVSPTWRDTTAPWGMTASFDWLARTALRPR